MTQNQPMSQVGPIYWELRDGPNGEVSASGFSESVKGCLSDIAAHATKEIKPEVFVIPPGLYLDGSPDGLRTHIKDVPRGTH